MLERPPPPRPCPSRGKLLAADPEVRRVGGALLAAGVDGRADGDPDPDLAELAPQDVRLVAGRLHPRLLDLGGGGEAAGAPRDVLAQRPALVARVAGAQDPVRHVLAGARLVREVAARDHVAGVALRRAAQLGVLP